MSDVTNVVTQQIKNIIEEINKVQYEYSKSLFLPSSFIDYKNLDLKDLVKEFLHAIKHIYLYFLLGDKNLEASQRTKKEVLKENVITLKKLFTFINTVYEKYKPSTTPTAPTTPPPSSPSEDDFKNTLFLGIFLSRNLDMKENDIQSILSMSSVSIKGGNYIEDVYDYIKNVSKKPTSISNETFRNYLVFKFILYELNFNNIAPASAPALDARLKSCINPDASSSPASREPIINTLISEINKKIEPSCPWTKITSI